MTLAEPDGDEKSVAHESATMLVGELDNTSGATDITSLTVHAGIDYHDDTIRVCVLNDEGEVLVNRDVNNNPGAVRDLVARYGIPKAIAIEACSGAAEFAEELRKQSQWSVRLAHPGYVRKLKQGPDKTDHGDAWLLADLVRVNYLPEVWLADEQTRQLRRLTHYRQGLAAERKNIKLRIRALLREERVKCPLNCRAWTKAWMEWLRIAALGRESRWIMNQEMKRLQRIENDMQEAEDRMQQATADDDLTRRLLEQDGIGLITAVTLRAEIGTFDRFRTGKQLAKFCGLTPCNASSGKREADAGLIRTGNRALRAVIIQAAQRLPRYVVKWKTMKDRLRQRKPANVATAAVANRWMRWLFHQMQPKEKQALVC